MKFNDYLTLLENKVNNAEILAPLYKYGEYYLKNIEEYEYWLYLVDRLSNYYKLFYKTTEDNNNKDYFDKATQSLGFNVENASQIDKPLDEIGGFVNSQNGTKNIDFKSDFEKNEHRFEIIEKYNKFVERFYPEIEEKLKKTNFYIFKENDKILKDALFNNKQENYQSVLLAYSTTELFLKNKNKKLLILKYNKDYDIYPQDYEKFYLKSRYIFQYVENLKADLEPFVEVKKEKTLIYNYNPSIQDTDCTVIYKINLTDFANHKESVDLFFNTKFLKEQFKNWLEIK